MTEYTICDAVKYLRRVLDKAPSDAISGEWSAITIQAGVSSQSGGYVNAQGAHVGVDGMASGKIIRDILEKLEASQPQPFNKVVVRWTRSKIPFMRGRVTVETIFDEAIVPRGPDHTIYEAAAVARRAFWKTLGEVPEGFAAERGETNAHNQTKWFGPHRRVLAIKTTTKLLLVTDGLSTPWAGVVQPENGVECELFLELDAAVITSKQIDDWAHLLISLGDLVADGYQVADSVEKHGAILFCRLTNEYSPMTRIILSRDRRRIEDLPFGSVALIRVTPIAEAEIETQAQSDEWAASAARYALANRKIKT